MGIIVTIFNILIAIIDYTTYYLGFHEFLYFIRNGNYKMHTHVELAGIKRATGSFTEASSFATYCISLFAFNYSLYKDKIHTFFTGFLCLVLFVFIVLTVSTTAYLGFFVYFILYFFRKLISHIHRGESLKVLTLLVRSIFITLILSFLLYFINKNTVILDMLIFNKMDSESGIQRALWNAVAWNSFLESYGIGIGFGSTRASSFLLVLLSNTGIIGTLLYLRFLAISCRIPDETQKFEKNTAVIRACREFIIANLIGACLSSGVFDLGLTIYIFAGAAAGLYLVSQDKKSPAMNVKNSFKKRW